MAWMSPEQVRYARNGDVHLAYERWAMARFRW